VTEQKYEYAYHWKNTPEREKLFGKRCRVVTMGGGLRTVLIEFEDGNRMVVSQRAIRRADGGRLGANKQEMD